MRALKVDLDSKELWIELMNYCLHQTHSSAIAVIILTYFLSHTGAKRTIWLASSAEGLVYCLQDWSTYQKLRRMESSI